MVEAKFENLKMKKRVIGLLLLILITGGTIVKIVAQNSKANTGGGSPDPQLSQKDNDYLNRQAAVFLDTVRTVLAKYPPVLKEGKERGYAKLLMDAVFHEKFAAFRKPAQDFFHAQNVQLVKQLETTKISNGARIWKVYDMGFIVRTRTVTIAFDLVSGITSGSKDFALPDSLLDRMVKQCDILFISHKHADHAEKAIAERFIREGKPVVSPEQVWKGDSISTRILHPERVAEIVHSIHLSGNRSLKVIAYPGHQMQSTDNNVVLVTTPDGITLAHTGDEINEGDYMPDFEWIDRITKNHKVDILMPNAWTMDISRIARGFDPKLVLPGHELELGHTVWDRLPYWGDDAYLELNYKELKASKYPVVALIWGESFRYATPKR
jgi:L-ascorbate metabolism protein UlaG (beta-lactamase superfamily)